MRATRDGLWLWDDIPEGIRRQERLSKSCADEEYGRLRETQHINKSLSALGDVIAALKHKAAHVPFRNSKLTFFLQDSMTSAAKILMIAQASPAEKDFNESVCCLNFAARVRGVELNAGSTAKPAKSRRASPSARC